MATSTLKTKIIYWITTGIIAAFILPGIFYAGSKMALEGSGHLGFPLYFHWELSVAKFLGGLVIIFPFFSNRLKEWAYVGLAIDFISAGIANYAVDGPGSMWWLPVVFMILLVISYITFHRLNEVSFGRPGLK